LVCIGKGIEIRSRFPDAPTLGHNRRAARQMTDSMSQADMELG
jgi:hypothetical protein